MASNRKPRKQHKPRARVMTPVERAAVRAAWSHIERDMYALQPGADCASIVNGLYRVIAPAHTIAEDRGMDAEVIDLLDAGMGALNTLVRSGCLWCSDDLELLVDAGWAGQQIMAQASELEQRLAVAHCLALSDIAIAQGLA